MFDAAPTRCPSYRSLVREAWFGLTDWPAAPSRDGLPDGRGQPVLVVPAFLTSDLITRRLRRFLGECGFRAFGWGLGVDRGPTPRAIAGPDSCQPNPAEGDVHELGGPHIKLCSTPEVLRLIVRSLA